ncbi:MAG: hypothetical protein BRD30_07495 [Bacteroidetes bacterium QH_2_63_10]|nr:MAG: hypothetical protein BRD30_07495 [Bacteroidetes bacterium QH_2_63_10]
MRCRLEIEARGYDGRTVSLVDPFGGHDVEGVVNGPARQVVFDHAVESCGVVLVGQLRYDQEIGNPIGERLRLSRRMLRPGREGRDGGEELRQSVCGEGQSATPRRARSRQDRAFW